MPTTLNVAVPTDVLVWTFGGKPGNLRAQNRYETNTGYNLHCASNGAYLGYVKTNLGINMGYRSTGAERKWHFRLPDGVEREILTGEPFALGLGGSPSFLRYSHQTVGINLEYVKNPVFQWMIVGASGEKGERIPTGTSVAIINTKVEPKADFLVYLNRPAGADVGWTTSPSFWAPLSNFAKEAISTAIARALS